MKRFLLFVAIAVIAALVPIAYLGWSDIYARFYPIIERTPPTIRILLNKVRGVGIAPVTVTVQLLDENAGLDEVVIRTEQKGVRREVLRQKLEGEHQRTIHYKFPGVASKLEEGTASIEVRAFDRSFWSNAAEEVAQLQVDYRKPSVDVLTSQHNARLGGSQLIFYKAFDESLVYSGVRVGNKVFEGFPAKGIDPAFVDPSMYAAIYAVDLTQPLTNLKISVFAEDAVGNATSTQFHNSVRPRSESGVSVALTEDTLRGNVSELFESNLAVVTKLEEEIRGSKFEFTSPKGGNERLIEEFKLINERLRRFNTDQMVSLISNNYRYEKLWDGPFLKQPGADSIRFGDNVEYKFGERVIGKNVSDGYDIKSSPLAKVVAANSGVVIFSDNLGVYGRTIAIDHGLGLVSLYSNLENTIVSEGDRVEKGQPIGTIGDSGLSPQTHVYYRMMVQGVPIDPLEWWDNAWVGAHIDGKVNEMKKLLGISRYVPLE